jgi:cellulose synthase (UDP-forming)
MVGRILRDFRFALFVASVLVADYVLLLYFDTLVWPNFWPFWALIIFISVFSLLLWFPEIGYGIWTLRITGLLLIIIGQSYLIHSFEIMRDQPSALTLIHLLGLTAMLIILIINYLNQIRPKDRRESPPLPEVLPSVAAIVPTYGEPYEILERTVASLKRLDYPTELLCIVISDDGRRSEIKQLARKYGVEYNFGPQKDAKAGNMNSALQYLREVFPQATLVLTQDADEVIHPSFLKKVVGYFNDPTVAVVQTPKEVIAPKRDPFGTRDRMFYDLLQVGRNGAGAAFACGSGVAWRIEAIETIGGFCTWNVVEDLTTSYWLHSAGYRSEYHNEKLSIGLAPDDIPGLLKQRGTWAVDTWRLFLFDNPLFKPGLSFAQRLQYLELGLFYVMSSFFLPMLMIIPVISLLTGDFIPLEGTAFFPWVVISILYYVVLSRGHSLFMLRMWQYWIGHGPTYMKAFWIALWSRHKKPKYVVTRKTRDKGFYAHLLWPQFLYLVIGTVAIIHGLVSLPEVPLSTRLANSGIIVFFMWMESAICRAAFYGVEIKFPRSMSKNAANQERQTGA